MAPVYLRRNREDVLIELPELVQREGKHMSTQKEKAWNYALGIIKVDGLEPLPEFLERSL